MKFSKLPLHMAIIAAMGVSGAALADGNRHQKSTVDIDKEVDVSIDVEHKGYIQTLGLVLVDSEATAISDVKQATKDNTVTNGFDTENNATADGDAMRDAAGNMGLNVAAGDNNVQQNSVAISHVESPESPSISIEAGYSLDIEDDVSFDKSWSSSSNNVDDSAWAVEGSVSHSYSHGLNQDVDGTYDHSQDEHSTSDTTIDANVTGDLYYLSGAGSESSKEMSLPESDRDYGPESGELEHEQSTGFVSGKFADFEAYEATITTTTPGGMGETGEQGEPSVSRVTDPSTFVETDTTETNSATTISATFDTDYSESKSDSFEVSGSASASSHHDDSESEEGSFSSSHLYDYNEYAILDAELVFGAALDAETFSSQAAYGNYTTNLGVTNNASLGGNVLQDAAGNVGVNIAAGNSNAQANQLAIAAGSGAVSALATASSEQYTGGNTTDNAPDAKIEKSFSVIYLHGSGSGTYSGTSDQNGNVYADAWDNDATDDPTTAHPTEDSFLHHIDYDSATQGAQGADGGSCGTGNSNGGAFCFDEQGTIDLDSISLYGGSFTFSKVYVGHTNNASIGGNALRGAVGNVGVNIAAGTNNLQGNALAISSISTAGNTGGGGTGGEF